MTPARVHSASPFETRYGFCRALRIGDRVEVAGTAPIGDDGNTFPGDAHAQATRCFAIALRALAELGAGPEHVVRTRMYIVDPADADLVGRAHGEAFGAHPPVATMVVVKALLDPAWLVEIEVEARV